MKFFLYKLLLYLLKALVYIKRFVFWIGRFIAEIYLSLGHLVRNSFGYRWYKWELRLKKYFKKFKISNDKGFVSLLGKRSTLQLLFLIVAFFVALPHSKLYTKEVSELAGRNTILFSLVGPGDQSFDIQEVTVSPNNLQARSDKNTWREGAIGSNFAGISSGSQQNNIEQKIVRLNKEESAVGRSTVLYGNDGDLNFRESNKENSNEKVEQSIQNTSGDRTEIIEYTVQSGDVIGSIAEKFGVSVRTILWANDLSYTSFIRPGDKLKILPVSGVLHTVKSGDTIGEIANRYDADIEDILEFNNISRGGNISIDEKLVIPDGEKPNRSTNDQEDTSQTQVAKQEEPEQEENKFRQVSAPPSTAQSSNAGYIWPTSVHRITQYFGWRHTGLDIAGPVGTPLYAARPGRVVRSRCGWNGGYGCYVILDHGDGIRTLYAHASRLLVSTGQRVQQGDVLAKMGSTGRSTGPHIHFEVRVNGSRQNPLKYIR